MSRRILLLCGLLPALAFPTLAEASDASMVRAIAPYRNTIEADVLVLAALNQVPPKASDAAFTTKLGRAQRDMATVGKVVRGQTPSSSTGRKAQANVLVAVSDAYGAAGDGLAAMAALRAGKTSTARADIGNEQTEVAKSIPYFSAAGKALGLFTG